MNSDTERESPDASDLETARGRYLALNSVRLQRVIEDLRPHQRDFLQILPLLFHHNHLRLPGYQPQNAVCGIPAYRPGEDILQAAERLLGWSNDHLHERSELDIQGLYLLTPLGALDAGQAVRFELWICSRPGLDRAQQQRLEARTAAIASYARGEFRFRFEARHVPLTEREGGISGRLYAPPLEPFILDQFYSSGIWLAGRLPQWWISASDLMLNATRVDSAALDSAIDDVVLDFGPLEDPPAEDLFYLGLERLQHACDAPYRALVELLLTEDDIQAFPRPNWASVFLTQSMHQGAARVEKRDVRILQYTKIERYLHTRDESTRLELVRRALYVLADASPGQGRAGWRRRTVTSMVQAWNWSSAQIELLDSRGSWKLDHVLPEWRRLQAELRLAYRVLSGFAQRYLAEDHAIDQALRLLGRRLRALLGLGAGQVERVNPHISEDMSEGELTVVEDRVAADGPHWCVYRGHLGAGAEWRQQAHLMCAGGLIELLLWCRVNGVLGAQTQLHRSAVSSVSAERELQALARLFRDELPSTALSPPNLDAMVAEPELVAVWIFVNTALDPMERLTRQGMVRISDRSDSLSFGARREILAKALEVVAITSWGEVFVSQHRGPDAVVACILEWWGWRQRSHRPRSVPTPTVHGFSCALAPAVVRRLGALFEDLAQRFRNVGQGDAMRYVLELGSLYYLLDAQDGELRCRSAANREELVQELALPQRSFSPVAIDRCALRDTPIPQMYERNRGGVVQLFYRVRATQIDVYVLDEQGSLYAQCVKLLSDVALVGEFDRFFAALAGHRDPPADPAEPTSSTAEYYQVLRTRTGSFYLEPRAAVIAASEPGFLEVNVIVETMGGGVYNHRIACDGDDFGIAEYGEELYTEVARCLRRRRRSGERVPICVTGVKINGVEGADLQTVHYLHHKRVVEARLNSAALNL